MVVGGPRAMRESNRQLRRHRHVSYFCEIVINEKVSQNFYFT